MCANAEHFNGFFEIYLFIFLSFAGRSPESATENSGSSFGGLGFFSYLCALVRETAHVLTPEGMSVALQSAKCMRACLALA